MDNPILRNSHGQVEQSSRPTAEDTRSALLFDALDAASIVSPVARIAQSAIETALDHMPNAEVNHKCMTFCKTQAEAPPPLRNLTETRINQLVDNDYQTDSHKHLSAEKNFMHKGPNVLKMDHPGDAFLRCKGAYGDLEKGPSLKRVIARSWNIERIDPEQKIRD